MIMGPVRPPKKARHPGRLERKPNVISQSWFANLRVDYWKSWQANLGVKAECVDYSSITFEFDYLNSKVWGRDS
jgi:hypothetical protein